MSSETAEFLYWSIIGAAGYYALRFILKLFSRLAQEFVRACLLRLDSIEKKVDRLIKYNEAVEKLVDEVGPHAYESASR